MQAKIPLPVIRVRRAPAINQKGNAMARPNYEFKKRQKELAKKKKKEEKKQRKLENKSVENAVENEATEEEVTPEAEDR